jgi:2-methylcitrate dehydratase PrpD
MSALIELGRHVAASAPPTGALRELLELHVIDTVGAFLAGARTGEAAALIGFRAAMRARGQADSALDLALDLATRCALARLSEIDDIDLASMTTPGAIVIPGALTLASTLPAAAADDAMAAMLAGYEVMTRLGRAIDGPTVLYRGIWPTYLAAPIGIAAVAARLLGLDGEGAAHALALALTLAAPGVGHHNAPTTARWLAVGNAARNGLAAALAAQQGFTSDLGLVEGGFLSGVYGITPDLGALAGGLGEGSALARISFKPWCAARQTMAATQALREIIDGGVASATIDRVEVSVLPPHRKMIDHGVKRGDRASHLTSVQFAMAAAAVAPELAFTLASGAVDAPPALPAFMERIKVEADESLLADYPRSWPARVRVTVGSASHERLVTHVPGDPARPFDRAQVREKFLRFVGPEGAQMLARCDEALAGGRLGPLAGEIDAACASETVDRLR